MAQIEPTDNGGKKKKGAQKKMHIHVDFTPMVDMNMLLITFFMLCTTMIKSQTLQIALPTNEKVDEQNMNKAKESEAVTMIVDIERDATGHVIKDENGNPVNVVYYYFGQPVITETENSLQAEHFIGDESKMQRGIRKILHDKNKTVLERISVLKEQWNNREFSSNKDKNDSIYQARAKEIRNDSTLERPVVVIKATPEATWESLINALDEMQINQISRYQIDNINEVDSAMIIQYRVANPIKG